MKNEWLQVTAKTSLGLAADDVFYFGNAIGETGDSAPPMRSSTRRMKWRLATIPRR